MRVRNPLCHLPPPSLRRSYSWTMEATGHEMKDVDDKFRESFKYFKRRKPSPDLSLVLDVRRSAERKDFTELKPFSPCLPDIPPIPGLQPVEFWQVFSFKSHPGFLYILNPFLPYFERIWAKRCLKDYSCKPNRCNLDAHEIHETSLWHRCINANPSVRQALLNKLRWVTVGYHHNWDTKVYSLDNHSAFPLELSHLARFVASAVGFHCYSPEAAIVNYYPVGSTLSGHTDHSEFDHESPIISFSFGCSAIFLLGGVTKDVKPVPIYIHSGDIVVMFGSGRLNYHGVPRIIPGSWHPYPKSRSNATALSDQHHSFNSLCDLNDDPSAFTSLASPRSAVIDQNNTSLDAAFNDPCGVTKKLLKNGKTDAKNESCTENSLCNSWNQISECVAHHAMADLSKNDPSVDDKIPQLPFPVNKAESKLRSKSETDSCVLELDSETQNESNRAEAKSPYSPPELCELAASDELLINEYLMISRINVNVRQVFATLNVESSCIS